MTRRKTSAEPQLDVGDPTKGEFTLDGTKYRLALVKRGRNQPGDWHFHVRMRPTNSQAYATRAEFVVLGELVVRAWSSMREEFAGKVAAALLPRLGEVCPAWEIENGRPQPFVAAVWCEQTARTVATALLNGAATYAMPCDTPADQVRDTVSAARMAECATGMLRELAHHALAEGDSTQLAWLARQLMSAYALLETESVTPTLPDQRSTVAAVLKLLTTA